MPPIFLEFISVPPFFSRSTNHSLSSSYLSVRASTTNTTGAATVKVPVSKYCTIVRSPCQDLAGCVRHTEKEEESNVP